MTIKMIIATGQNNEIGQDGRMPWCHMKEDMQYFKEQTKGDIVIMGRKTYDSLPFQYGLPDRTNWVLTQRPTKSAFTSDLVFFSSMESILRGIDVLGYNFMSPDKDVWIIGGAEIYKQFMPYVQEVHWTIIKDEFPDADTHLLEMKDFISEFFVGGEVTELNDMALVKVFKRIK